MKIRAGMKSVYASLKNEMTQDGRNNAVISYAERWAEMMEKEIGNSVSVSEAAAKTRFEANKENLSGLCTGMLSVCWLTSGNTARNCGNGSSKATVPSRYRSKNRRRIRLSMHRLCHNLTK